MKKINRVNLDSLPRLSKRNAIDWSRSIGCSVEFEYEGKKDTFLISDYNINKKTLKIIYNGKKFYKSTDAVKKAYLKELIHTYDYFYIKNDIEKDGNILVTTQEEFDKINLNNSLKKIKFKCKCGNLKMITHNRYQNLVCKSCDECTRKKQSNSWRNTTLIKTRIEVEKLYKERNCVLLDKYKSAKTKMKYIGSCGHDDMATYDSFKNRKDKTGLCSKCARKLNSGENTYNWKGGTYEDELEKFRKTYEYKNFVKKVFSRDKYKCAICGKKNNINAHHLNGYNWFVDGRTNYNNAITLCEDCHKNFHIMYGYGDNTVQQFKEYIEKINYNNIEVYHLEEENPKESTNTTVVL